MGYVAGVRDKFEHRCITVMSKSKFNPANGTYKEYRTDSCAAEVCLYDHVALYLWVLTKTK